MVDETKTDNTPKRTTRSKRAAPLTNETSNKRVKKTILADESVGQYFLMKAEPESRIEKGKDVKFSINDLAEMGTSMWDGVRNHEAKKNMQAMKEGDLAFFYHSNCKAPGIAGICKESYPDHTAWDPDHPYFDHKSDQSSPKWFMVNVEFVRKLNRFIPLKELQTYKELKDMELIRRGRLSVQKVTKDQYEFILQLENKSVNV